MRAIQAKDHFKILALAAVGTGVGWVAARLTGFEAPASNLWRSGLTFLAFYAIFVLTIGRQKKETWVPALAIVGLVLLATLLGLLYRIL